MELDRRDCIAQPRLGANRSREELWGMAKPFVEVRRRLSIGSRVNREIHARF